VTRILQVRFPDDIGAELDKLVIRRRKKTGEHVSISSLIRELVEDGIAKERTK
jgi:Arc/MetJ-type ribon-helix-helix transcriptional regulator